MRWRRQFHTRGRQVVDFTDEVLGRPDGGEHGDTALLAAVNAPRGDGMREAWEELRADLLKELANDALRMSLCAPEPVEDGRLVADCERGRSACWRPSWRSTTGLMASPDC
jgi:hypothetical protein